MHVSKTEGKGISEPAVFLCVHFLCFLIMEQQVVCVFILLLVWESQLTCSSRVKTAQQSVCLVARMQFSGILDGVDSLV